VRVVGPQELKLSRKLPPREPPAVEGMLCGAGGLSARKLEVTAALGGRGPWVHRPHAQREGHVSRGVKCRGGLGLQWGRNSTRPAAMGPWKPPQGATAGMPKLRRVAVSWNEERCWACTRRPLHRTAVAPPRPPPLLRRGASRPSGLTCTPAHRVCALWRPCKDPALFKLPQLCPTPAVHGPAWSAQGKEPGVALLPLSRCRSQPVGVTPHEQHGTARHAGTRTRQTARHATPRAPPAGGRDPRLAKTCEQPASRPISRRAAALNPLPNAADETERATRLLCGV
jgi:hypothetical protein